MKKRKKVDKRLKWLEEHADEAVKGIDKAVADVFLERVKCNACGHIYEIYPSIPASDDSCPVCGSTDYRIISEEASE